MIPIWFLRVTTIIAIFHAAYKLHSDCTSPKSCPVAEACPTTPPVGPSLAPCNCTRVEDHLRNTSFGPITPEEKSYSEPPNPSGVKKNGFRRVLYIEATVLKEVKVTVCWTCPANIDCTTFCIVAMHPTRTRLGPLSPDEIIERAPRMIIRKLGVAYGRVLLTKDDQNSVTGTFLALGVNDEDNPSWTFFGRQVADEPPN